MYPYTLISLGCLAVGNHQASEVSQTDSSKKQRTVEPTTSTKSASSNRTLSRPEAVKNQTVARQSQQNKAPQATQQTKTPDKPKHLPVGQVQGQGQRKKQNSPRTPKPDRGRTTGIMSITGI